MFQSAVGDEQAGKIEVAELFAAREVLRPSSLTCVSLRLRSCNSLSLANDASPSLETTE